MWPQFTIGNDLREEHAFRPVISWPNLRVAVDPALRKNTELDLKYLDSLRRGDSGIQVLTRVERGKANLVGDYEFCWPDTPNADGNGGVLEILSPDMQSRKGMFYALRHVDAAAERGASQGYNGADVRRQQLEIEGAHATGADLFITDNRFADVTHHSGLPCLDFASGLTVIGLQMRLRDKTYLDELGRWPRALRTREAENAQSWHMLAGARQVFELQPDGSARVDEIRDLLRAASVRLRRCLGARDLLLARSIHPAFSFPNARPEELVERIALNLSAMFDALARSVNVATGAGFRDRDVSVRSTQFWTKANVEAANVILSKGENTSLLRLIGQLRNTIHSVNLGVSGEGDARGRVSESYVDVPARDKALLLQEAQGIPGSSSWIAHDIEGFDLSIRAVPMVESLLTRAVALFEDLTATVPWPGVPRPNPLDFGDDPTDELTYRPNVERIAALYGL